MLTNTFLAKISEIAQLSLALPILVLVFRFKRFTKLFWTLAALLLVATIISYSAYVLYENQTNNMFLLHIYVVLEYVFWSAFYYQLFKSKVVRKVIVSMLILFVIFSVINTIYWQSLSTFNSYSRSLESGFLLCFAIAWFYKVFVNGKIIKLETHPVFWINAGVLVYFSGSFLLFISNNFLVHISRQQFFEAWALHGVFLIIHYLLIAIGIWLIKYKKLGR